jgi:hypothetical protein
VARPQRIELCPCEVLETCCIPYAGTHLLVIFFGYVDYYFASFFNKF